MRHFKRIMIFFIVVISNCSVSKLGTTIPRNRVVDWTKVGYHNDPSDNLPVYTDSVFVPKPANNLAENYSKITKAINKASNKKGVVAVIFKNGVYKISKTIVLSGKLDSIILKGSGNTTILFVGNNKQSANILQVVGSRYDWQKSTQILNYDENQNKIKTSQKLNSLVKGDFLEIRIKNGSWHDSEHHNGWNPQNYVGQIVRIVNINQNKNEIVIDNSFKTIWDISQKENLIPFFIKITPIQEVGIEDLKITTNNKNNRQGFNINFSYAANCWVKNVESAYAASTHLHIGNSTSIEVRNSIFHHARDYGNPAIPNKKIIAGTGYGIDISRSSNCLVENNIFYHLRHAMLISLGSNCNVFGYNYSYDQYSFPVKNLADLNLHGHFPFNNLFEGNIVERIHADKWWGSNGPNNTFVRNIVTDGSIKLEKTNKANLLGNEAEIIIIESDSILESYSKNNSHKSWNRFTENNDTLDVISFYKKKRPSFIEKSYSWPPIGPSIGDGNKPKNLIPAQIRAKKLKY